MNINSIASRSLFKESCRRGPGREFASLDKRPSDFLRFLWPGWGFRVLSEGHRQLVRVFFLGGGGFQGLGNCVRELGALFGG